MDPEATMWIIGLFSILAILAYMFPGVAFLLFVIYIFRMIG